jgi:hypothetical protein
VLVYSLLLSSLSVTVERSIVLLYRAFHLVYMDIPDGVRGPEGIFALVTRSLRIQCLVAILLQQCKRVCDLFRSDSFHYIL